MDILDIEHYPNGNTMEWYICPSKNMSPENLWIDIGYSSKQYPSIHFRNPMVLDEYAYKELVYQYDRSNDSQKAICRSVLKDDIDNDKMVYSTILKEEHLPSHRFPCSTNIDTLGKITRKSYKINNRIYFIEDEVQKPTSEQPEYVYYLRYNHSQQVDIRKMKDDFDSFVKRFKIYTAL